MSENLEVIYILDGGPMPGDVCAVADCFQKATGRYEVCDADTMEFLTSVALCEGHGRTFATGLSA